jgi:integrase
VGDSSVTKIRLRYVKLTSSEAAPFIISDAPDLSASVLERVLDATTIENLVFLVSERGEPFSAPRFGNWFREPCREAGLPRGCSAHGLRKAAARRLAEAGCTAHEIAAMTGHPSLREIEW